MIEGGIIGIIALIVVAGFFGFYKWGGARNQERMKRYLDELEARKTHDEAEAEWDGAGGLGASVRVRPRDK